ncbi:methyltransferase domain-containing protein [archaeon]|nr:methyltransferase domain-containing protein [archaeon]
MKLLFVLSGWNLELAKEEVLALAGTRGFMLFDNLLILNCPKFDFSRLAFTKKVLELIFICKAGNYECAADKIDWEGHYRGNFSVRAFNSLKSEAELAGLIWHKLKKPKVNLSNPSSQFEFYFVRDKAVCGLLLSEQKQGFQVLKYGSIALSPKLARAVINLTAIKPEQTLLDPFCGTGGFLVEASKLGFKALGSDINRKMIYYAKKNLRGFGIKNCKVLNQDATKIKLDSKVDAIATDLPYGRRSSLHKQGLNKLVNNFLKNADKILNKHSRMVVILPFTPKIPKCFKSRAVIKNRIHRSLTRHIVVVERT